MKLFDLSEWVRSSPSRAWTLAVIAVLAAIVARFAVNDILPPGFPYLTFFPAVILTAFFGGLRPGIGCAAASGLASWFWFIPPFNTLQVDFSVLIALIFYACIVSVDILLIHFMQLAMGGLRAERATTAKLYEQQRVMFQELQHRVANNMQFVSSLLSLQKRKVVQDPSSAATSLDAARDRLDTISRIHRRLYDPETVNLPVGHYLEDLCNDVIKTSNAAHVTASVEAPDVRLDLKQLTTLSLIVVEALTNALKHAFDGRASGHIDVRLEPIATSRYRLVVADNGVGFDGEADPAAARSLGQRIMQSLAAQLDGEVAYARDNGTRMMLDFSA